MPHEPKAYLQDTVAACDLLLRFTAGKSFAEYEGDPMLRAAVEREFEIAGEALSQLARRAPQFAERIQDHRRIIGFRNVLVHGYARINDRRVWDAIESDLPRLRRDVQALLEE